MITISLCMIVRDEEKVLSRILGQMQEIADEIIIVDTGSEDRTKEIAEGFHARIFDFPWIGDFSAARNFACEKARMDYWMWLDADDVITESNRQRLIQLKQTLEPETDVVMMKYLTGFDEYGNVSFSYYRERLIKNNRGFFWKGKVHEAVEPAGKIQYIPIEIEHRKIAAGDPDRNLNIYEAMIQNGEALEPRHLFYYGRELYYHQKYERAAEIFQEFLQSEGGWMENKIDACLQLSYCYEKFLKKPKRLEVLFYSFIFDEPRAEICCEIGRIFIEQKKYNQAVYWYRQALNARRNPDNGAFMQQDCYDYIPNIQLCVCYDRLGRYEEAFKYHEKSMKIKPDAREVQLNISYFDKLKMSGKLKGISGIKMHK
ncbi:SPBc2 prophage-derived glycosyltransferase SunS [uncultured Roseburia sp.]|uniref:Glycosyltransferase n=1 Tax=Brotonthovivens ammoniilytica TaxID=2981725 RepID=A0ABT2TM60_9FIRM|nr:glycosyltransferase family 2 protein [Brotonthovivens ammoniilytica]MCU6763313.1 glycosyltransferase [Brotonthovivens ammoniilytica]SCJ12962.1 SPBc2 prophage-derived glycosyltransferase SunS [uncultured Roseburia sp.]